MKKKRGIVVVSLVHLILWTLFLLVTVIEKFTFQAPEMEPLEFAMEQGIYTVFIIISAIGMVNAAMLFLSLRAVLSNPDAKHKGKRKSALCVSVAATVLFYLSAVLIFAINKDIVMIVPAAWLLCELCSGVLLAFSVQKRKDK